MPCTPRAARGAQKPYLNPLNNNTYILNSSLADFFTAQQFCLRSGGHLASFTSGQEQQDVEQFYIKAGLLFPSYHKSYWFGLYTNAAGWKNSWKYTDNTQYVSGSSYANWGVAIPQGLTAPNNITGQEFCVAANASEAQNSRWGWEDYECTAEMPFLCEIPREPAAGLGMLLVVVLPLLHPAMLVTIPACCGKWLHASMCTCSKMCTRMQRLSDTDLQAWRLPAS